MSIPRISLSKYRKIELFTEEIEKERERTREKNKYELLIEAMVVDSLNHVSASELKTLKLCDTPKKRIKILNHIGENKQKFIDIVKASGSKKISTAAHLKTVVSTIRDYIPVADVEVKKFGEKMTPLTLVEDMMDMFPLEVWEDPSLKWLDPCAGIGTFQAVIIPRLMEGLKHVIEKPIERYKHIIENMIYVCELQTKNLFLFLCAFDPKDRFATNIYNGSFLTDEFDKFAKERWGIDKFDIIVGNPPYQSYSPAAKTPPILWDKFVYKGLTSLVTAGYLAMVHPPGWRDPRGKYKSLQQVFKKLNMQAIKMFDKHEGQKVFEAATPFDYYILEKVPYKGDTKVTWHEKVTTSLDISKLEFLPDSIESYQTVLSLYEPNKNNRVQFLASESAYEPRKPWMSGERTDTYKYPCVYTITKDGNVNLKWSSRNDRGHFGIPKVIFSNGISEPIIDYDGKYGLTQFAYAIVDDPKNLEDIRKALLSEKFLQVMSLCDGNKGHRYKPKFIELFRRYFWKEFI